MEDFTDNEVDGETTRSACVSLSVYEKMAKGHSLIETYY